MPTFKLTWTIDAEGTDALDAARRVATDYVHAGTVEQVVNSLCHQLDREGTPPVWIEPSVNISMKV